MGSHLFAPADDRPGRTDINVTYLNNLTLTISPRQRNSYRFATGFRHQRVATGCKLHASAGPPRVRERAMVGLKAQQVNSQWVTFPKALEEIARHSGTRFA